MMEAHPHTWTRGMTNNVIAQREIVPISMGIVAAEIKDLDPLCVRVRTILPSVVGADSPAFPFVVNSGVGAILETSPCMAEIPSDLPLRGQRRNGRDLCQSRRTGFPFHPPRLGLAADTCDTHYIVSCIGKEVR